MTAKKTSAKKAAPKRKPAAKKVTDPKTIVVDKPKSGTPVPRHRKTGEKYKAPKLVRKNPPTRDEQAALDRVKIKGQ